MISKRSFETRRFPVPGTLDRGRRAKHEQHISASANCPGGYFNVERERPNSQAQELLSQTIYLPGYLFSSPSFKVRILHNYLWETLRDSGNEHCLWTCFILSNIYKYVHWLIFVSCVPVAC